MVSHRVLFFSSLLAVMSSSTGILAASPDVATRNEMCLKPENENPFYWQYKGKAVILLGGSVEDNLFQIPNLPEHLDLLKASGGNYVRNTLSSRDDGNLWMFQRRTDGKYDLEQSNEAYYERLKYFLDLCLARDIIVQFELWDRFDYARTQWHGNPFRPVNNINYTTEQSGLKNEYPRHPGTNDNPFFRSIPKRENNQQLLKYQRRHMERVLAISLPYPNVLYCMDNETQANPDWGAYWSGFVKEKAKSLGVIVQTTEMWDNWNLQASSHRQTLDHPETYSFVDTSQNNHQKGQQHWDNFQWVRDYLKKSPRPINHVKTYGAGSNQFGDARDGVERFWRSFVGGAASSRFHRPTAGLGLSKRAQSNIKSARMLSDAYDFTNGSPLKMNDVVDHVLRDVKKNEAHVNMSSKSCAIYMPRGGEVRLISRQFGVNPSVRWLDIEKSEWKKSVQLNGTAPTLKTPGAGQWLALVSF